jgi:FixJ family two-component response regulator
MKISKGSTIAILDDDPLMALTVGDMAESMGLQVDIHHSVKSLLHARKENCYSLLVMDLCLPDFDGIDLLMLLATDKPREKVLLMSGQSQPILDAASAIAKGKGIDVLGVLQKPFRAREFASAIG